MFLCDFLFVHYTLLNAISEKLVDASKWYFQLPIVKVSVFIRSKFDLIQGIVKSESKFLFCGALFGGSYSTRALAFNFSKNVLILLVFVSFQNRIQSLENKVFCWTFSGLDQIFAEIVKKFALWIVLNYAVASFCCFVQLELDDFSLKVR